MFEGNLAVTLGLAGLCLVSAGALVLAELGGNRRGQWLFKPLAALAFVGVALAQGAPGSGYGRMILAGLVLSALGDVLLLPRGSRSAFQLGMLAFGGAHIAYTVAFLGELPSPFPVLPLAGLMLGTSLGLSFVAHGLRMHLTGPERPMVAGYMLVIALMIISAGMAALGQAPSYVFAGALMFAVSDLFVARDRFVAENPRHALFITPLYFGAQVLFALSV